MDDNLPHDPVTEFVTSALFHGVGRVVRRFLRDAQLWYEVVTASGLAVVPASACFLHTKSILA